MAKLRPTKIADILGIDKKLYKLEAVNKHPYITAFKHMCYKTGNGYRYKNGYMTGAEAYLVIKAFKDYKAALPSKNRRYTQAQLDVIGIVTSFSIKSMF